MKRRILRSCDQPIVDLATHPARDVTLKVLAAWLECDRRTLVDMLTGGQLLGYRVGREWRIVTASAREMFPMELHQRAS